MSIQFNSSHVLGLPRIGANREMKKAVENYWRREISSDELQHIGQQIENKNWQMQADAGLDFITVGDFSWYDHVLDHSALFGVIPERFNTGKIDLNTLFYMARGQAPDVQETTACAMTKWFNTNYHYMVPEFCLDQTFQLSTDYLFSSIDRALAKGYRVKPVLLGPLTYLWLGKSKQTEFNKLNLLENLLPVYNQIFAHFRSKNIEWVQIDEPLLALDIDKNWQQAYIKTYQQLNFNDIHCLLTTYFGDICDQLSLIDQLPIHGLHIDCSTAPEQLPRCLDVFPKNKVLSLGFINGRNIWRADLTKILTVLRPIYERYGENLWLGSSCSLLHVPVDLDSETKLDPEIKNWFAFSKQKLAEIALLSRALHSNESTTTQLLIENQRALHTRKTSTRIQNSDVQNRIKSITPTMAKRNMDYISRAKQQKSSLQLNLLPTTTIGSFPQTSDIRKIRLAYKSGKMTSEIYQQKIKQHIADVILRQEALGLDVLVHGEAERNDMVEYFGECLEGFVFTKNGWVQSYGSRCVKPPIIYGDVHRPKPMTVEWSAYSQGLTQRPVKGMLTGPTTLLAWSFVRDDQPYQTTGLQIALALRDEVLDLERAGIRIIQIDEPAFRERLPLRRKDWKSYLDWAVFSFRIASSAVQASTQIHTHMCYSEFNDVMEAIAALDADVITLESSRSNMKLLHAFESFSYPNEIGPGIYDIHSPRVPSKNEMINQLKLALRYIPIERLWVNPDCGLKTRHWNEVTPALQNMIEAAQVLREDKTGMPLSTNKEASDAIMSKI
ncbi:5-methyltetrahydropteroyltriglutamate--homocysteine S-methyltransferase [Rickettsiella grylli]|uniref:5-methyltetrahydropteroyltriglutamate-- homocysteine S-methyltransferase n=1 Tax=Rickettsiella grylli TaxID=59196 RepID=UPI0008FCEB24|nr:5-methyltetrahydropteroyltriglutamate--homocysteine S-methyltransferase [Rickettsiella grylli]OJA00812.1 5-methyltetrahydropteroyltriglutamate--homocysteine S-methyltransferase [Rickettsiella grylli]